MVVLRHSAQGSSGKLKNKPTEGLPWACRDITLNGENYSRTDLELFFALFTAASMNLMCFTPSWTFA